MNWKRFIPWADRRGGKDAPASGLVAIVGNPNVGKSVLFNNLTGRYATVSNYPGTTVEISSGLAKFGDRTMTVADTPGMYSLLSITDEERVGRRMLLAEKPVAVIHVIDAKNMERMLQLTVPLIEMGLPVVVALNMMDEAKDIGLAVDVGALREALGVEVVPSVFTAKKGMKELRRAVLAGPKVRTGRPVPYPRDVEEALGRIEALLHGRYAVSKRGMALLLLEGDAEAREMAATAEGARFAELAAVLEELRPASGRSVAYRVTMERQRFAHEVSSRVLKRVEGPSRRVSETLGRALINPWVGVPVALAVLYVGLYKFVGQFGAGTLVDLFERKLFGAFVNPHVNDFLGRALPGGGWHYWARELFGGDYGVITLALTYAVAIVLPIVLCFFLFFSILEDSGYFPRLAMTTDRAFKSVGLSGRAVIPLVLGLGCGTMATLVTRVLETKREKIIVTMLLALAIPCSAQYGVIAALLTRRDVTWLGISAAFVVWLFVILAVFLVVGFTVNRILGGERPSFYMELPPLRMPRLDNVIIKTWSRMKWYFMEVLPLFALASLIIWIGRITRLFDAAIAVLQPAVHVMGLPAKSAEAFLYGFFRRDFGAAGLYTLDGRGLLDGVQVVVACVALTMFVPCIAQFLMMKKEQGLKMSLAVAGFSVVMAFAIGAGLNVLLRATHAHL